MKRHAVDVFIFYAIIVALVIGFIVREHRQGSRQPRLEDRREGWRSFAAYVVALGAMLLVSWLVRARLLDDIDGWANLRWLATGAISVSAGMIAWWAAARILERDASAGH